MFDEKLLVKDILAGNEKTLRFFYRHFKNPLMSYIKNKVGNPQDAEEIMQDVLLSTIEAFRDFTFRCRIFTYICSIANHKIIDYYRRKKIKNIVFSRIKDVEPLIITLLSPENTFDDELLKEKITLTFSRLAPLYRKILTLKYIDGYSVSEIARMLSLSFKSAESHLFRARRAFAMTFTYERR